MLVDQQKLTLIKPVRILDVVLRTHQECWPIGMDGESEKERERERESVLLVQIEYES